MGWFNDKACAALAKVRGYDVPDETVFSGSTATMYFRDGTTKTERIGKYVSPYPVEPIEERLEIVSSQHEHSQSVKAAKNLAMRYGLYSYKPGGWQFTGELSNCTIVQLLQWHDRETSESESHYLVFANA